MVTGQWLTAPEGHQWFFDSGSVALDFGYTGDYGYGVSTWERLHRPADLTDWLTERFGPLANPVQPAEFDAARRVRAAIWWTARHLAAPRSDGRDLSGDIDVLNHAARPASIPPHLDGGTQAALPPSVEAALSTIARDAIIVFGAGAERIRHCGADDCQLIFYDASRPNSRRWCSMKRCGNRAKVRAHRTQRAENSP